LENQPGLNVYPNPAANNVMISFVANANSNYEICIYDAIGNKVAVIFFRSVNEWIKYD